MERAVNSGLDGDADMSTINTRFSFVKEIAVEPAKTQRIHAAGDICTMQEITIVMEDGSSAEFSLFLKPGCRSLQLGEIVTNDSPNEALQELSAATLPAVLREQAH
jgi:hypothetical protein